MHNRFTSQFIVFTVIFFLFGFFAIFLVDSYHDSFVMVPAIEMGEGKILFRDTFTQYGALFTILHAVGLKIFGVHTYTIRLTTLLFYSVTAAVIWSIYRRFLPSLWNVYAIFLWIVLSPIFKLYFLSWSSIPAAFFQCISLLFVIWFIEQNRIKYVILAGASSMLAFWTRQPVGILNSAAIIAAFLLLWFCNYYSFKKTCSILLWFVLGNIVGFLPIYIWLLGNNALQAWWHQSFEMQAVWAKIVKGTGPDQILKSLSAGKYLKNWKSLSIYGIWILIPMSTLLVGYSKLQQLIQTKTKNKNTILLLIIACVCTASWHQYYPAGDPYHYFWANIPTIGLFVYTLFSIVKLTKPFLLKPVLVLLFLLTGLVFIYKSTLTFSQIQTATYTTNSPLLLQGVPIKLNEKIFFESIDTTLTLLFSKFPDKTYVNESGYGFYPLFYPSHFKSFKGIFVDWGEMTEAAGPGFTAEKKIYITNQRPFIFAMNDEKYIDYCEVVVPSLDNPPIKLFAPRELVSQLQELPIHCEK